MNNFDVKYRLFQSFTHFYREAIDKERPEKNKHLRDRSNSNNKYIFESDNPKESFIGDANVQETIERAKRGWQVGIDELEPAQVIYQGNGNTIKKSMVGSRINMGAVIGNDPMQFYKRKRIKPFLKRLNVFVQLNYRGDKTVSNGTAYAKGVMNYINTISEENDVAIYGYYSTIINSKKCKSFYVIRIKDFGDMLTLNSIAFAFHPSFYRRFYWRLLEQTDYCESGVGFPNTTLDICNMLRSRKYFNELDDTIVLPSLESLGSQTFYEIKESSVKKLIIKKKTNNIMSDENFKTIENKGKENCRIVDIQAKELSKMIFEALSEHAPPSFDSVQTEINIREVIKLMFIHLFEMDTTNKLVLSLMDYDPRHKAKVLMSGDVRIMRMKTVIESNLVFCIRLYNHKLLSTYIKVLERNNQPLEHASILVFVKDSIKIYKRVLKSYEEIESNANYL